MYVFLSTGGFSKTPGVYPDPLHSHMSICGFSLLHEKGFAPISSVLGLTCRAFQVKSTISFCSVCFVFCSLRFLFCILCFIVMLVVINNLCSFYSRRERAFRRACFLACLFVVSGTKFFVICVLALKSAIKNRSRNRFSKKHENHEKWLPK